MNNFYKQPVFLQWFLAIGLLILGFLPAILLIELAYINPLYILLFFVYVPIGQFSTTPIFKLTKIYTYYSPMLLGYIVNATIIDLHSGLSFDYLFVMRKYKAGAAFRNKILEYHFQGLLTLISQI